MVCSPYRIPFARWWCTSVVISRAPDAPSGWPSAMAPPFGFSDFSSVVAVADLRQPGQRHGRERLVDLEDADLVEPKPAALQHLPGRRDRRGEHDDRVVGGQHRGVDPGDRGQPELAGPFRGGHQQRGGAVGDLAGVAGRDHAVRREGRPQRRPSRPGCRRAGHPRRRCTGSPPVSAPGRARSARRTARHPVRPRPSRARRGCTRRAGSRLRPQRCGHHLRADALVRRHLAVPAGPAAGGERVAGDLQGRRPSAPGTSTRPRRRRPGRTGRRSARPRRNAPTAGTSRTAGRSSPRAPTPASRRPARRCGRCRTVCSPTWPTHPQMTSSTRPGSMPVAVGQRPQHMRGQVDRVHAGQPAVPLADRGADRLDDHRVTHGDSSPGANGTSLRVSERP